MLQLLLGRNQNSITECLLTQACGENGQSIVIVPEQYSHVTERRLCALGGDTISARAEVLTFSRLAHRVFQECGGSARPMLDKGGRLLLMHLAVCRMAGELTVYARSGKKASFLTSLLATSDECKSCCIPPELLLEAAEQTETESGRRLKELGLILGAYNALVAQRAEDPRDRLTRLAQALKTASYLNNKSVYLDGFTDFTPQERLVLAVMLRKARRVTVGLRCDTLEPTGDDVFAPTRQTALGLVSLARENGSGMEFSVVEGECRRSDLEHLESQLFAASPLPAPEPAEHIFCTKAEQPYAEAEQAAEEILRLVREEGLRFRDIAVAVRSLEDWDDRLETVFRRYGIPVFLSQMDDILQKPVLTLITAALDAVTGGYEYDDLFRYLKTGLTGITREERDKLENYVLRWDIRGSYWSSDKDWRWHPEGYGQPWTESAQAELALLNELRLRVIRPLERLRKTEAATGRELARALYRFLEEIELPECLTWRARELTEAGALREAEEYRQVWEILVSALEQCSDLLGEDPMSLAEFAELFRLVLSQYQVGAIPVSLDRVTCGDMARLSHASFQVLFLLGADDGSLPMVHPETGLLTREDKALLSELGAETPLDADQRLDREMLLIYECCTMPSERLYVSWSAQSMEGGEKRPSFLIPRLQMLFPRGIPALQPAPLPGALPPALDAAAKQGDRGLLQALAELPGGGLGEKAVAAMEDVREDLAPEAVGALYKGTVRLSASRMDKVKSCHYAYFLQYGLKAKARKPAGMDAPEAGTFVHFVLETVLRRADEMGGVASLEEDEIRELAREATETYIQTELGGMEDKTPRFRYLFRRLADSAAQVVLHMVEELKVSDFAPIAFELGFGEGQDLPPVQMNVNGIRVSVSGFVDRVDGWVHDGKLYVRVMDYKTGKKAFDLTDIWHGLNLQMLLYLFALEAKGMPGEHREIVPAGVLYLPARESMLSGSRTMPEDSRLLALDKKLKRSGLILNDPNVVDAMEHVPLGSESRFLPVRVSKKTGAISGDCLASAVQLGKLRRHIDRVLANIAREIGGGNICADPWYRDEQRTACAWCDFAAACHFEDGLRGEKRRYLYPMKGEEFWEQLDEIETKGGE